MQSSEGDNEIVIASEMAIMRLHFDKEASLGEGGATGLSGDGMSSAP